MNKMINIAEDFNPYVLGRYKDDSDFNGTKFQEELLLPAVQKLLEDDKTTLTINLNGLFICDPSFLEESFGGTIRALKKLGLDSQHLWGSRIKIIDSDESELESINGYIRDELNV